MLYTTDQIIILFKNDKSLIFQAYTGAYEGEIIRFNNLNSLVWDMGEIDEGLVMLNEDFINTKWKMISPAYVELKRRPLINVMQECLAFSTH